MKSIAYIIMGLLYFYIAYRSFLGNIYGNKSIIIDAFIIFTLSVSIFLAKSNIEYTICIIGSGIFFLFELIDIIIYHKKDVSHCLHLKKSVYGVVILSCFITIIIFMTEHIYKF